MNIEGKLIEKFDTQKIKETFKKREFVIEFAENPQYPELIKFELIQGNCEQLDGFQTGDMINVSFNLKGRKWTNPKGQTQYFTTLQAWRLDGQKAGSASPQAQDTPPPGDEPDWINNDNSDDNDLPF